MINEINKIWLELESEAKEKENDTQRAYRRIKSIKGFEVRIGCFLPKRSPEILIQTDFVKIKDTFPEWRGMTFENIVLDIPKKGTNHLKISLTDNQYRDVFSYVCSDLINNIKTCKSDSEIKNEFKEFLYKWTVFFKNTNGSILSDSRQLGLWGELNWLHTLLKSNIKSEVSLKSWIAPDKRVYDFDIDSQVVEVKATRTKEPRKIIINNEKQLNDIGLKSLHLLVFSAKTGKKRVGSLPEIVERIKKSIDEKSLLRIFENKLIKSGYLKIHEKKYMSAFIIEKIELFKIRDGFPRIITLPKGTGDIKYSILISSCMDYQVSLENYLKELSGD